jgi:hypothetical protein
MEFQGSSVAGTSPVNLRSDHALDATGKSDRSLQIDRSE